MSDSVTNPADEIEEFFARLTPGLHDTTDVDGVQIEGLEKFKFRPLDAKQSIEVEGLAGKHGSDTGSAYTFIRALVRPDGSQFLTDDHAERVYTIFGGVIARAMRKIRFLSGIPDKEDAEKKTRSMTVPNLNSGSGSPKTTSAPLPNS